MPPATPGNSEIAYVDRAQIERNILDWSMMVQQQDQAAYNKATNEAEAAYKNIYQALQSLRNLHKISLISRERVLAAGELVDAINEFRRQRDEFNTKLAAVAVLSDVWRVTADQQRIDPKNNRRSELLYDKGALNLKAFSETYFDAIKKIVNEASQLTYKYSNNMVATETKPGMGLENPETVDTPESLRQQAEIFKKKATFTEEEKEQIAAISIEMGRQIQNFLNETRIRAYWLNDGQKAQRQAWVDSLERKFRVAAYFRGVYCMPMSVPAINIPVPTVLNLDYFNRSFRNQMSMVQKGETNEDAIRTNLFRLEQTLASAQSQSGMFNDVGGVSGFIHTLNSTFAWHNEVAAYLSVITMLRDAFNDEVDMINDNVLGCNKVRARYIARYKTYLDEDFQNSLERIISGSAMTMDATNEVISAAGMIISTKGEFVLDYQTFLREHPAASVLKRATDRRRNPGLQ